VVCTGPYARWMSRRGWGAVTLPWPRGAVILVWTTLGLYSLTHEYDVHVPQIRRMGGPRYLAAYGWHWLRIVVRNRGFAGWHDQHPMERP
jgi:hypothetical protein